MEFEARMTHLSIQTHHLTFKQNKQVLGNLCIWKLLIAFRVNNDLPTGNISLTVPNTVRLLWQLAAFNGLMNIFARRILAFVSEIMLINLDRLITFVFSISSTKRFFCLCTLFYVSISFDSTLCRRHVCLLFFFAPQEISVLSIHSGLLLHVVIVSKFVFHLSVFLCKHTPLTNNLCCHLSSVFVFYFLGTSCKTKQNKTKNPLMTW